MTTPSKILIVDDTPDTVMFLADRLAGQGYAVVTASSGVEALEQVEKEQPDLVLLDVLMPKMSGYEVCRQIRENPATHLLPVVLLTALNPSEERVKGIEAGADDFLTKPANQAELLARVRSLLRIKDLHDQVQAQTAQLAEWNKELEARLLQEARVAGVARALGDIGHDMKNLLTPVLMGAGLLQSELEDLVGSLPQGQGSTGESSQKRCQEVIDMVRENARRLQDQVRELADCVKGLSNPPHFAPCAVAEVVTSVIKTLRILAEEKGLSLHTEGLEALPPIQADERRLFSAFYNLINNAIPEVPAGGSVTVRGRTESEGKAVIVSVADTGRGMPVDVRERLFTSRVMSRKAGGTGLGTKIVKDMVEVHGGTITVESEEGVGTTFHISLPVDGPKQAAVESS